MKYAGERGVKIAIENCPMIFSYDEWPGGNNLASTPAIWRKMWEIIPDDNFGLNLDPSHLILQMIDIPRVVREFGSKIFHVHAKDLHIDREGLYNNGVFSLGMGWQIPRLPGLGDMDWAKFFAALTAARYDGVISIEHEDRVFEGDEDTGQTRILPVPGCSETLYSLIFQFRTRRGVILPDTFFQAGRRYEKIYWV